MSFLIALAIFGGVATPIAAVYVIREVSCRPADNELHTLARWDQRQIQSNKLVLKTLNHFKHTL